MKVRKSFESLRQQKVFPNPRKVVTEFDRVGFGGICRTGAVDIQSNAGVGFELPVYFNQAYLDRVAHEAGDIVYV